MLQKIKKMNLVELADKYENSDFIKNDPSKFMHGDFPSKTDTEIVAFIAANLAFGKREQILLHIQKILSLIENDNLSPKEWIVRGFYEKYFEKSDDSFYRMYTFNDLRLFFDSIKEILILKGSLENAFKESYFEKSKNAQKRVFLHEVIQEFFPVECKIVSHSKNCAAKKLNLFLRWLVRDNSEVDLGFWKWYDKKLLLIPLDTHVMSEAFKAGFIKTCKNGKCPSASLKTSVELTEEMKKYFPDDPARADFALFGLGVDKER